MSVVSEGSRSSGSFNLELQGGNYQIWKYRMQMLLVRLDLWDVVSGDAPRPVDDGDLQRVWDQRSLRALAEITERLGDVDIAHVRRCRTAQEAWEQLAAIYEPSGLACQVFLSRELSAARLNEGDPPREHFARMVSLADELRVAGQPVSEDTLAWTLLASLPPSYDPIVQDFSQRRSALTNSLVISTVIREDARRRLEGTALDGAPQKTRAGFDDVVHPFFAPSPPPGNPAPELPSRFSVSVTNSAEESVPERVAVEPRSAGNSYINFPLTSPFRRSAWYLHSSAPHHMTSMRNIFTRFEDIHAQEDVLIDGRAYAATGAGDVRVVWETATGQPHRVLMRNVRYVPSAPASFVAVAPLVAKGVTFSFREGMCVIEAGPDAPMGHAVNDGNAYRVITL